ncbi:hypothetical protein L6164_008964 [Bauhinia variegata]|uniref:Uncharacterized protein n=1 Tax=Bauhinia variegata TaxID=167791 RepID=A0ACB9PJP5_BAUVA|nr:hypothetical protein L6164_008964 [Bauhinia variegata]
MFAVRNLRRHCLKPLSSLLQTTLSMNVISTSEHVPSNVIQPYYEVTSYCYVKTVNPFSGSSRTLSTSRGRSMRSKVERRMQKESGKTLREIRRAKKLKKKLMTEEERLIYNLKRAKKKVALLLQKLKNMSCQNCRHLGMTLSSLHLNSFKHLKKLDSGIRIMFQLVYVESLEELCKICISIGSFMRLCKFVVITSPRKKSKKWLQYLQD